MIDRRIEGGQWSKRMLRYRVPFNRPFVAGKEFEYMREAVLGLHLSGDGPFTKRCSRILESLIGASEVLLTTSCTHALELAALLLDVKAGDEVIVPSFAFVSTINAFALRGAKPVFGDIRADTLNLDERGLPSLVGERTKAIVPVHYAGVGCEMDEMMKVAREFNVAVVEDNAHGLLGYYRGKPLGSFGELATLSFHETKNYQCGEGGALVVNDSRYRSRAEILREKGTNRSAFFRNEVSKYTWVDIGSSYLPADILAAFLLGQLEAREMIQAQRKRLWEFYYTQLSEWATDQNVQLPTVPPGCDQAYHMFYLILPSSEHRQALIDHLAGAGVQAVFHYLPLHLSPMGRRYGFKEGDCPVAEDLSARLLRLPFYLGLTEEEREDVVSIIRSFRRRRIVCA